MVETYIQIHKNTDFSSNFHLSNIKTFLRGTVANFAKKINQIMKYLMTKNVYKQKSVSLS